MILESVAVHLTPPPDKLAVVAEEVEMENGGGGLPRREERRSEIGFYHNTVTTDRVYCHFTHIFV